MSKRKQVTVPMEKIKEQDKYINEIKNEKNFNNSTCIL